MVRELCNLAVVCAQRKDNVMLQVSKGQVIVHIGQGHLKAEWDDNEAVKKIIHELNFGKYNEKMVE